MKTDPWEVYTSGRVNAFFGYASGDAKPAGNLKGGGFDTATDKIPVIDPATGMPSTTDQGTISKMRFRSGFVPNVLTVGVKRTFAGDNTLKAQFSLWGTIETAGQRKFVAVATDFREGYLEVAGRWGAFTAGRFLSLFSRGVTETDFMYGHGYGVGFWGGGLALDNPGPTAGLIGFGVLAASFSPGMMYTTPDLGGFKANIAVFDPVNLPGSWESTRSARPEAELTYDLGKRGDPFMLHVYVNGAFQKVYAGPKDATVKGVAGGFRAEVGGLHIGAGAHTGKGLGLYYALEGSEADTPGVGLPFRTADGYSVFLQYSFPVLDLNAAFGQSRIHLTPEDTNNAEVVAQMNHPVKTQTGISAGVVYHVNENLHLDLDYLRAMFRWYGGSFKQDVNYINTGVTVTW